MKISVLLQRWRSGMESGWRSMCFRCVALWRSPISFHLQTPPWRPMETIRHWCWPSTRYGYNTVEMASNEPFRRKWGWICFEGDLCGTSLLQTLSRTWTMHRRITMHLPAWLQWQVLRTNWRTPPSLLANYTFETWCCSYIPRSQKKETRLWTSERCGE